MSTEKKNILILFGGCSPEHGVSLESAAAVISRMNREKYLPVTVGITREGDWYLYRGPAEAIADGSWAEDKGLKRAFLSPNRREKALLIQNGGTLESLPIHAAFPVLHGQNGEDGTVQGLIELADIPLIGCGVLASALCMDKDRAHRLAAMAKVRVPTSYVVERGFEERAALARAESLGYPLFVKPVRAGSSFGVTRVKERTELIEALYLALMYDGQALMEEAIPGFEVGCAVMDGNEGLVIGEVDEIELAGGFFDFTEKYGLVSSKIHVPARIAPETADRIKDSAGRIYRALGCSGFARVDLFLTPGGEIVFNEVNTIPGFTAHSRFPGMMRAAGIPFDELIGRVIEGALKK